MNDEAALSSGSATDTHFTRCGVCGHAISRLCVICRGAPDLDVTLERLAAGCAEVERAVRNRQRAA